MLKYLQYSNEKVKIKISYPVQGWGGCGGIHSGWDMCPSQGLKIDY